jgi:hypothetical protein
MREVGDDEEGGGRGRARAEFFFSSLLRNRGGRRRSELSVIGLDDGQGKEKKGEKGKRQCCLLDRPWCKEADSDDFWTCSGPF